MEQVKFDEDGSILYIVSDSICRKCPEWANPYRRRMDERFLGLGGREDGERLASGFHIGGRKMT